MQTQIWIDADSCPLMVRNHTVKQAKALGLSPVQFVANKSVACDFEHFKMTVCEQKKDAADDYILEHAGANDLVITRDIVLLLSFHKIKKWKTLVVQIDQIVFLVLKVGTTWS